MSNRLDPELVELCRPSRHACVAGSKRIQMLEELAIAVGRWLGEENESHSCQWNCVHCAIGDASAAIDSDNERVDRMNSDYDAAVEKLEAEPNGGWVQFNE